VGAAARSALAALAFYSFTGFPEAPVRLLVIREPFTRRWRQQSCLLRVPGAAVETRAWGDGQQAPGDIQRPIRQGPLCLACNL